MPFAYNGTGIKVNEGPKQIPEADYILRIIKAEPGVTKKGDDRVSVDVEIVEGDFRFETVKFHQVTFFRNKEAKAAGMAIHFLKSIGEPWEGDFQVDERNWIGKKFLGHIAPEMCDYGKHKGKVFPRIKYVEKLEGTALALSQEEVPF